MRIGIVGASRMGGAIGLRLAAAGHRVTFSYSRDPAKLRRLARAAGPTARAADPRAATADADAVLLAVRRAQVDEALAAAGPLDGTVLIDCTNPMTPDDTALAVGHTRSGAEEIAGKARGARVVKAFNTVPSELLRAGPDVLAQRPMVCYCGDDAKAKALVASLIRDVGFEPVDAGGLAAARYLEPFALLIGELAYNRPGRPEVGVRFLRPGVRRKRGHRGR